VAEAEPAVAAAVVEVEAEEGAVAVVEVEAEEVGVAEEEAVAAGEAPC
jgi:hypothetical protein